MIKGFIKYSVLAALVVGLYFAIRQISKYIPHAVGFFIGMGYNVFEIIKGQLASMIYFARVAFWYLEMAIAWGVYYIKLTSAYLAYYSEIYTGSAALLPSVILVSVVAGFIYIIKNRVSDYYCDEYEYS